MNTKSDKFLKNYGYALIVSGSLFVVTILTWFLIISPLYTNVKKSGAELASKEQQYTDLTNKKNRLDELKDKEVELKKQATIVSNALPKNEDIGRLFIQLDALARSSNGVLSSVNKSTTSFDAGSSTDLPSSGITKTVYTLPLSLPTYFDLKTFISDSQAALRLFNINNFNISASDAGALTVILTANSYTRN